MGLMLLFWLFSAALLTRCIAPAPAIVTYAIVASLDLVQAIDSTSGVEPIRDVEIVNAASGSSTVTATNSQVSFVPENYAPELRYAPVAISIESSLSFSTVTEDTPLSTYPAMPSIEDKKGRPRTSTCSAHSTCPTHVSAAPSLDPHSLAPIIGISLLTIAATCIFGNMGILLSIAPYIGATDAVLTSAPMTAANSSLPFGPASFLSELGGVPMAASTETSVSLSMVTEGALVSGSLATASIEGKKGTPRTTICSANSACTVAIIHGPSSATNVDPLPLAPLVGVLLLTVAVANIFGNTGVLLLFARNMGATSAFTTVTAANSSPYLLQDVSSIHLGFAPTIATSAETLLLTKKSPDNVPTSYPASFAPEDKKGGTRHDSITTICSAGSTCPTSAAYSAAMRINLATNIDSLTPVSLIGVGLLAVMGANVFGNTGLLLTLAQHMNTASATKVIPVTNSLALLPQQTSTELSLPPISAIDPATDLSIPYPTLLPREIKDKKKHHDDIPTEISAALGNKGGAHESTSATSTKDAAPTSSATVKESPTPTTRPATTAADSTTSTDSACPVTSALSSSDTTPVLNATASTPAPATSSSAQNLDPLSLVPLAGMVLLAMVTGMGLVL